MQIFHRILTTGLVALLVLALACTSEDNDPTVAPAPTATPTAAAVEDHDDDHAVDGDDESDDHADDAHEADADHDVDLVAVGREVYSAAGCAACHGVDAEGSDLGPALSGHNALQVRRQVRAPVGIMTVFNQSTLSAEDLDALVAYVETLSGGHSHGAASGLSVTEQSFMHHRMALTAFESENFEEAEHHLEHLTAILEGQHLALMQEAMEAVHAGNIHDAQHMIEGMLADVLPPDQDLGTLHYQLALAGIRVGDTSSAAHHLEHISNDDLDPSSEGEVDEILSLISLESLAEAEEHLSTLMGVEPVGVDAAHEEGDGHGSHAHEAGATHEEGDGDQHAHAMDMQVEVAPELEPIASALEAIAAGDLVAAGHEIEHFAGDASTIDRLKAEEALAALTAGHLHDAEDLLRELLGETGHAH